MLIVHIISTVILLWLNKGLIDATVYSELVQVTRCDLKPGSVKRSINVDKRGRASVVDRRSQMKIQKFIVVYLCTLF
jgi:hypothetical protein